MLSSLLTKKQSNCIQLFLVFAAGILLTANVKAYATPKGVDVFSTNTPKPSSAQKGINLPWQNTGDRTPIVIWFERFDNLRKQYRPTEKDKIIISRPLMQDAERVQQWTNTASKISKNYLALAKSIRTLTVPTGMSDVKEYRDLVADWYQDAAGIYIDLIKPRTPAKTVEDLQEELDAVKKRSESLANNIA